MEDVSFVLKGTNRYPSSPRYRPSRETRRRKPDESDGGSRTSWELNQPLGGHRGVPGYPPLRTFAEHAISCLNRFGLIRRGVLPLGCP